MSTTHVISTVTNVTTANGDGLDIGNSDDVLITSTGALVESGSGGTGLYLDGGSSDCTVVVDGEIYGTEQGIYSLGGNNTIVVNGEVSVGTDGDAIDSEGDNARVDIGASGIVSGFEAVSVTSAAFGELTNDGTLMGTGNDAVFLAGGSETINVFNNGLISSAGTAIEDDAAVVYIDNTGTIEGDIGLDSGTPANAKMIIDNSGVWQGGVVLPDGPGQVTNSGLIEGNVGFGNKANTLDNTHGQITGIVNGGSSTDTFLGGEHDDSFFGFAGNDTLSGAGGNDTLYGGAGIDHLNGGDGHDTFIYVAPSESTGTKHDTITGFDATQDQFEFVKAVKAVDGAVKTGQLRSGSHFNSDLAAAITSAHLKAHDAVLFTPSQGTYAHDTFLIVDANGHAGYQANADFVIALDNASGLSHLSASNFIVLPTG